MNSRRASTTATAATEVWGLTEKEFNYHLRYAERGSRFGGLLQCPDQPHRNLRPVWRVRERQLDDGAAHAEPRAPLRP